MRHPALVRAARNKYWIFRGIAYRGRTPIDAVWTSLGPETSIQNPDSGSNVYGGSVGGPIIRNKLVYFFNYEGTNSSEAANLDFTSTEHTLKVSAVE